ncbi:MAG: hypothetical protein EB108_02785 [Actinobacteria bacterium]|nr:hypothetical protein [Actinomycetota bacterium]
MFRLSLKMTVARKGRLLLTSLAIILGTSFLSGTTIFSDTINSTFDRLFTDVFRDVDAYVRSTDSVDTGFGEVRASSPVAVLDKILNVKGVAAAVGDMQSYARVIAKDGKSFIISSDRAISTGTVEAGKIEYCGATPSLEVNFAFCSTLEKVK